jgi:hypothetical protein
MSAGETRAVEAEQMTDMIKRALGPVEARRVWTRWRRGG